MVGLRADEARFQVHSPTEAANSGRSRASLLSPKFALIARPWARTEVFFNAGRGFHSNDARGTTARIDPRPATRGRVLACCPRGFELGLRSEWLPGLQSSLACGRSTSTPSSSTWAMPAPPRPTAGTRRGIEWNHLLPVPWLLVDADLAWTHVRFANPRPCRPSASPTPWTGRLWASRCAIWAPGRAACSGATWARARWSRTNSVRSRSSLTTNLRISHKFSARTELSLDAFNLLNRSLNDIEYYYESQLFRRGRPVADRHSSAERRSLRLTLEARLRSPGRVALGGCSLGGRCFQQNLLAPSPSISAGIILDNNPSPAPRRHQRRRRLRRRSGLPAPGPGS